MKRSFAIFLVLLGVGFSLSSVNIVSPKDGGSYYLGEQIPVAGSISSGTDCYGTTYMKLDNGIIDQAVYNFTAGSVVSLDTIFSKKELAAAKGTHSFEISGTCVELKRTYFNTTDQLDIVYEVSSNKALVSEVVSINAYAFRREKLTGKTQIFIPNRSYSVDSTTVSFDNPGIYPIRITANDEFGNNGEANFSITVSNKLVVTAALEKQSFKPSDNVSIQFSVWDEFGRLYENYNDVTVLVFVGDSKVDYTIGRGGFVVSPQSGNAGGGAQAPDKIIFVMPERTPSGSTTIKVSATKGKNYGEKLFDVNVERVIRGVQLKVDKDTVEKGDTVGINLYTYDQTNDSFIIDAPLFVIAPDNSIIVNKDMESFTQENVKVDNNLKEGTYVVKATVDGQDYLSSFNVVKKGEGKNNNETSKGNVTIGPGITGAAMGGGDVAVGALLITAASGLGAYWYLKVKKK